MHTVAVLSLKGGVGKTTVALGISSAALRRNQRTLLADLDPQGNATATLDPPTTEASLADVLDTPRPAVLGRAIAPSAWSELLDVLVSTEDLEPRDELGRAAQRVDSLAHALELSLGASEPHPYELAVLDCPPSLGRLTRSALVAADSALVVAEPTMYAVTGARRALEVIDEIRREHNANLHPVGVLVNRLRARSHEHQFRLAELRESFGQLVMPTAISDRLAVQQSQGACAPIHDWQSPGAQEIGLAFNMVLAKIVRSSRAGRHRVTAQPTEPDDTVGEGG